MTFKLLTCCLISLMTVCITRSQHQQPKTTPSLDPEEEKPVQKLAQNFVKRLQETRDVEPLVAEMFAGDFKKLLTQDGWWAGLIELPFPLIKQLDEDERYRLYVTQFSLHYLIKLYDLASSTSIPPKVGEYVKSANPPTGEITNHKDAVRLLTMLENALKLMREEIASNPPEESEQFKKNSAAFNLHLQEPDNPWGRPFVTILNRDFILYPKGTRLVKLEIPFHNALMLVKENGQFKIALAMTMIPPD